MRGRHAMMRLMLGGACALLIGLVLGGYQGERSVLAWTPRAIVRSTSSYTSSDGQWLVVVGEVENVSSEPLDPVRVVATYRDAQGHYVGRDLGYALVEPLLPGQRAPFLILDRVPERFATYDVRAYARPTHIAPLPALDVSTPGSMFFDQEGALVVVGEVVNPLDVPVQHVRVPVTFYDETGKVVNVAQAQVLREVIPPGSRSPFVARVEQGPTNAVEWRASTVYEVAPPNALVSGLSLNGLIPYIDRDGSLVLHGIAHNAGKVKANFVRVVAALYDSEGRILNASFSYPLNYHLAPGASDVFEIRFYSHFDTWSSYKVFVDSTP